MNVKLYDIKGNEKGTVELSDTVFKITPNKSAIYYALRAELANERLPQRRGVQRCAGAV